MSVLDTLFPELTSADSVEEMPVVYPDEYLEGEIGFTFRHLSPTPSA